LRDPSLAQSTPAALAQEDGLVGIRDDYFCSFLNSNDVEFTQ
jgi:hypothetical protein